ncbi:MAG: hypothetical protein WAV28_02265 [Sedimentisphaerales bacterium]
MLDASAFVILLRHPPSPSSFAKATKEPATKEPATKKPATADKRCSMLDELMS